MFKNKLKNIFELIKLLAIEGKMNNPFEVKRYWSDSAEDDVQDSGDINTHNTTGRIISQNQETDILKKLKSKAKNKCQPILNDTEPNTDNYEQTLHVKENIAIKFF